MHIQRICWFIVYSSTLILFKEEQINPDPEGWVLDILTDPEVKVVVIENSDCDDDLINLSKSDNNLTAEKRLQASKDR